MPTALVLYASPSFPREGNGKRVSLSGTGLVSGKTVEAYGTNEGDGTVLLFFAPIDESSSGTTATGSLSGEDLVLTDSRTGERVTYRRR